MEEDAGAASGHGSDLRLLLPLVDVALPLALVVTVSEPRKVSPWPADPPEGVPKYWMVKLRLGVLVSVPETVLPAEPVMVGKFWPSLGKVRGLVPLAVGPSAPRSIPSAAAFSAASPLTVSFSFMTRSRLP